MAQKAKVEAASMPPKHWNTPGCFPNLCTQHPLRDLCLRHAFTCAVTHSHEEATHSWLASTYL